MLLVQLMRAELPLTDELYIQHHVFQKMFEQWIPSSIYKTFKEDYSHSHCLQKIEHVLGIATQAKHSPQPFTLLKINKVSSCQF